MKKEELEKYFHNLSKKIMKSALTPEQSSSIITYLRKKYPYDTEQGKVYSKVMIETGAGETLLMMAQFLEGKEEPEQFAIDFVGQV